MPAAPAARAEHSRPDSSVSEADEPEADAAEVARTIALRKLSAQARTRTELARALRSRNVPDETATEVLDRLDQVGLIDDAKFARDWVTSRQVRRRMSRTALRRELQAKGVDRDTVDEALDDVAVDDEHGIARELAIRKARTMSGLARDVRARRLAGVLGRRGFSSSVIGAVLRDVLDLDDLDLH